MSDKTLDPCPTSWPVGFHYCKDRVNPPPWQGGKADVAQPASSNSCSGSGSTGLVMPIRILSFPGHKSRCGLELFTANVQVAMSEHVNRLAGS